MNIKKAIIISLLTPILSTAQSNFRLNQTEFFTVSVSIDPGSSIKEQGLDYVAEIEYAGNIYAKIGFEQFSAIYGGYNDIHGAVGINFTSGYFEKIRYYAGVRMGNVYRGGQGAFRTIYGLESGIDYEIKDYITLGLRSTLDKRIDQEIFRWEPENKFSGFIRICYKWKYNNHH